MHTRLAAAAVSVVAVFGLPAPEAFASTATACSFDGTLTFTPPLTLQPAYGTVRGSGVVTCASATAGLGGATWAAVVSPTQGSSQYAGSCLEATYTDGYGLSFAVAGSAVVVVWTNPFYAVQAGVLTPIDGSCLTGLRTVRLVTAGPGFVP